MSKNDIEKKKERDIMMQMHRKIKRQIQTELDNSNKGDRQKVRKR